MEYTWLGRTGVQVSRLCFGTMSFGGDADVAESARLYRACREQGILPEALFNFLAFYSKFFFPVDKVASPFVERFFAFAQRFRAGFEALAFGFKFDVQSFKSLAAHLDAHGLGCGLFLRFR